MKNENYNRFRHCVHLCIGQSESNRWGLRSILIFNSLFFIQKYSREQSDREKKFASSTGPIFRFSDVSDGNYDAIRISLQNHMETERVDRFISLMKALTNPLDFNKAMDAYVRYHLLLIITNWNGRHILTEFLLLVSHFTEIIFVNRLSVKVGHKWGRLVQISEWWPFNVD